MFGISDYGAFTAAFVLLLFLPGPGNLALITSTSQGGLAGGVASVLGLLLGVGFYRFCLIISFYKKLFLFCKNIFHFFTKTAKTLHLLHPLHLIIFYYKNI